MPMAIGMMLFGAFRRLWIDALIRNFGIFTHLNSLWLQMKTIPQEIEFSANLWIYVYCIWSSAKWIRRKNER